jgi:hypothetical protein
LFDSVVTPCVLYGSGSWSLTKADEQKLRVAQRRMLRAILGKGRKVLESTTVSSQDGSSGQSQNSEESREEAQLESWQDWIQRTTHEALEAMGKVGLEDWVVLARKRKWQWACKIAKHSDARWTQRILMWEPNEGFRVVGHPMLRWIDPIDAFARTLTGCDDVSDAWIYLLSHEKEAAAATNGYLQHCEPTSS